MSDAIDTLLLIFTGIVVVSIVGCVAPFISAAWLVVYPIALIIGWAISRNERTINGRGGRK